MTWVNPSTFLGFSCIIYQIKEMNLVLLNISVGSFGVQIPPYTISGLSVEGDIGTRPNSPIGNDIPAFQVKGSLANSY